MKNSLTLNLYILLLGVICIVEGCASGSKISPVDRFPANEQSSANRVEIKAFHEARNAILDRKLDKLKYIFDHYQFSQEDKDALLVHYAATGGGVPVFFGKDESQSSTALDAIGFLIEKGGDIQSLPPFTKPKEVFKGSIYMHALNYAVEGEDILIVKYMLDHGADPNSVFCYDPNDRPYAAENGEFQALLHGTAYDQAIDFASRLERASDKGFQGDAKMMRRMADMIKTAGGHSGDGIGGVFTRCADLPLR